MKRLLLLYISFIPFGLYAQLPQTNLYAFDIKQLSDTTIIIDFPRFLSDLNRDGYNNQPVLINKHEYLLSVGQAGDAAQPDIFKFNLITKEYQQITATSAGEYSPAIAPTGGSYRCVRLSANGDQFIWEYPMDASSGGQSRFDFINNVGYFADITDKKTYVFLTGDPHQLAIINEKNENKYVFTSNIGRTLKIHDNQLYFVHKLSDINWYIKRFNPDTKKSVIVVKLPGSLEDFEILENGIILIGQGSELKIYDRSTKGKWRTIADLSEWGIDNITRLHAGFGKLMLVDKISQ